MTRLVAGMCSLALFGCGGDQRPLVVAQPINLAPAAVMDQEILIQAKPNALCTLGTETDQTVLSVDADALGLLHVFIASDADISQDPHTRLTCTGLDGIVTRSILDMSKVSATQSSLGLVGSRPIPGSRLRGALQADPASYSQAQLVAMGYPPRPDAQLDVAGYKKWLARALDPVTVLQPQLSAHPGIERTVVTETQDNWSGIDIHQTATIYLVMDANWWVPPIISNSGVGTAAIFVGFDGTMVSNADELAQSGTDSDMLAGNMASYYAWTEWWPGPFHKISNMVVHPRDTFYVEEWIGDSAGNPTVTGTWAWSYVQDITSSVVVSVKEPRPPNRTYKGTSASWVVERGRTNGVTDNLARYGSVQITNQDVWDQGYAWHGYSGGSGDAAYLIDMVATASGHLLSDATAPGSNNVTFVWDAAN